MINVTATGETFAEAIATAYAAMERIQFDGMYYRTDIGQRVIGTVSGSA